MGIYYNTVVGLVVAVFLGSILALIISLIMKKPKKPWLVALVTSFIFSLGIVYFSDSIFDRLDSTLDKVQEGKSDPEGTIRIPAGKYMIGEEVPEGFYDISFQKDTGSLVLGNLYMDGDFRDTTSFGKNPKFRLYLRNGEGLTTTGVAIITPAFVEEKSYETVDISAGFWLVGDSIAAGKYKVENIAYPGYLKLSDKLGGDLFDSVLHEGIILDLKDGDVIRLTGTGITLVPSNS